MKHDSKVALVTGASRGIGAATARLLARHGAAVAVNFHKNAAAAGALASEIEPAPAEPAVTLSYVESRLAGASGCNHYSGAATAGATPGEVSLGPVMSTRMACGDPADLVERRFLDQLGGATRYAFMLGQLALSYRRDDGVIGVMLFDPRPASEGP